MSMKKALLTSVILFLVFHLQAQIYYPMLDSLNRWTVLNNAFVVSPPHDDENNMESINCQYPDYSYIKSNFTANVDTVINGMAYKIVELSDLFSVCTYGYVREDVSVQKVYFMDNMFNPEEVLYDFTLQTGDSINLNFYFLGFSYFNSGLFFVDSVTQFNTVNGLRKMICLSQNTPNANPLYWLEGVGYIGHPFYTYSYNSYGGFSFPNCSPYYIYGFSTSVICYEHLQNVYHDSCYYNFVLNNTQCYFIVDSCDYYDFCTSIISAGKSFEFSIYPVPAKHHIQLKVQLTTPAAITISIYDGIGKKIIDEKFDCSTLSGLFHIDTSLLKPGMYITECSTSASAYRAKFVIQ